MEGTPERREIHLRDVTLSYLEWGEAEPGKPSLLILHGLIAAAETFDRLAAELNGFHIVALDFPGELKPEAAHHAASFAALAELVRLFATAKGLEKPILLGHSHGGGLALQLAVENPEGFHALILLCPAHPFSRREDRLVSFYLSPLGRAFAHLLPHLNRRIHLYAFQRMPGTATRFGYADLEPYVGMLRRPGTVQYILRLLGSWKRDMTALGERLERAPLSMPVLLLWGEQDIVVPIASASRLLEHLQACEMITMPDVGHLPNEEAPVECALHIRNWLMSRG